MDQDKELIDLLARRIMKAVDYVSLYAAEDIAKYLVESKTVTAATMFDLPAVDNTGKEST